jgi:hypothetical protein
LIFVNWLLFLISLINIVFDLGLDFIIYFGLFFIRLSWPHDPRIMFNSLTQFDFANFLSFFLFQFLQFSSFNNGFDMVNWELSFIIYFSLFFYGVISVSWPKSQIWHVHLGWIKLFVFQWGYLGLMTQVMGLMDWLWLFFMFIF